MVAFWQEAPELGGRGRRMGVCYRWGAMTMGLFNANAQLPGQQVRNLRRWRRPEGAFAGWAMLALALPLASPALALDGVVVTPLVERNQTASGQPIVLPQKDVRVVVSTFDIAPGAVLPVHKHPYARYAVVQAGSLMVTNNQTNVPTIYKAGDFVVEMIDEWHHARNVGPDPVKLLVIDQIEGQGGNTILHP